MSAGTKIQWADDTWNPWRGCRKVSAGCDNKERVRAGEGTLAAPYSWNKKPWVCNQCGQTFTQKGILFSHAEINAVHCCDGGFHRRRAFSLSLGDIFDDEVPIEWLGDALKTIHDCPNLDFLLLTKRPELWQPRMRGVDLHAQQQSAADMATAWLDGRPPENIWLGVSVENQDNDWRIPELLKIPAKVRFLSCEPLLGAIDLNREIGAYEPGNSSALRINWLDKIDWVIIGGESGKNARPCNTEWIRSIVQQCRTAGVACFVKQLGAKPWMFDEEKHELEPLRDKKGGDMSEWPEDLRVREFPQDAKEAK